MSERLVPTNDWVLLSPEIEHEEVTKGGLILPKAGQEYESLKTEKARREHRPDRDIQKTQSRGTGRYEVLAVGPGTFLDVSDDLHQNVFLRKPMSCAPGDVVLAQQGVVPVVVNGGFLNLAQDYSILAIIHKDASGPETLEPLHDYIFTKEADAVRKSTGGIYMPGQPDATGNKAMPDRWEVLGVGEGPWCLKQDKGRVPELARRPMPVKPGDELCFAGAGFQIAVAGAVMTVVQAYQVAGVFEAT